jgi:hypothetical protein
VVESGLLNQKWVQLFELEFEIVLGCWLISGWARRLAWLAALACFIVFCGVTAWEHFSGYASCGCFGTFKVPPWKTLVVVDIPSVALLLLFRPRSDKPRFDLRWTRPAAAVLLVGLAAAVGSAIPVLRYTPPKVADDGRITGAGETVLLEPEEWVGKELPIARYIDVAEEISRGEWTAVLVHDTCVGCKALIPKLADRARALRPARCAKIALILMPENGKSQYDVLKELVSKDALFLNGRLDLSHEWLAATPIVLQLRDGKVISVNLAQGEAGRAKAAAGPIATTQAAEKEVDLGTVAAGSVHRVCFRATNPASASVRILADAETPNVAVANCPKRIAPWSFALVEAELVAPKEPGTYIERIGFETEASKGPTKPMWVVTDLIIIADVER